MIKNARDRTRVKKLLYQEKEIIKMDLTPRQRGRSTRARFLYENRKKKVVCVREFTGGLGPASGGLLVLNGVKQKSERGSSTSEAQAQAE